MDYWDQAIGDLKEELPRFNHYTIRGYREEQVNRFPEYINTVFSEAVQLFGGTLKHLGYRILPPEKRLAYNVDNKLIRGRVDILPSELELVEYMFEFEGQQIPVHMYLPYLHNGHFVIEGTRYHILNAIIERVIYRVTDGVLIKVMRSPMQFWRMEQFTYSDTNNTTYCDTIITTKVYYRTSNSSQIKTPLVLYLLANFGYDTTREMLGIPSGSVVFTTENEKEEGYSYFKCKEDLFLKVHDESVLSDVSSRRFVASMLYILKMAKRFNAADVNDKTFYKMVLGKNLHGAATKEALAVGHVESHLDSLKTYLDKYTQNELRLMNIYCDNVYDLFVTVYFNIDSWLVGYSPNDLFEKRIGGAELLLIEIVKSIFNRFYDTIRRHKVITIKNIKSMLHMDPMKSKVIRSNTSLQTCSSQYNDNVLTSELIKKVRQSSAQENTRRKNVNLVSAKEHQFHPSFVAVESALAISTSSPGATGDINPFVAIDKIGCFQKDKMPWYDEITPLSKYLVQV